MIPEVEAQCARIVLAYVHGEKKRVARDLLELEQDLYSLGVVAKTLGSRMRKLSILVNPGAIAAVGALKRETRSLPPSD